MPVSMRIHEPLELLAISGVAEIFHEFREFALGGDELLAFLFQPREFSGAPFVEGAISGRAHAKTGGGPISCRKAPAVGTARPVRPVSPFFSPEGYNVARVTGFLLPEFPAHDRETDRPVHEEAQNHRQDFHWLPRLSMPVSAPAGDPGVTTSWHSWVTTRQVSGQVADVRRTSRRFFVD